MTTEPKKSALYTSGTPAKQLTKPTVQFILSLT